MKDKSKAVIRKLQTEGARIAKRRGRLDDRVRQLADDEKKHRESVEALILGELRSAGVMNLPLSAVLEGVRAIGQAAGANSVISAQATLSSSDEPEALLPEACGSKADGEEDSARDGHDVFVKISRNTSADNRRVLEGRGLRWNGKLGGWKGNVNGATLEILEKKFDDRLTIPSKPTPTSLEIGSADPGPKADAGVCHGPERPAADSNPSGAAAPIAASIAEALGASTVGPATEFGASRDATDAFVVSGDGGISAPWSLPTDATLPKNPFATFARRPPVTR
jgi:hypothetical protein